MSLSLGPLRTIKLTGAQGGSRGTRERVILASRDRCLRDETRLRRSRWASRFLLIESSMEWDRSKDNLNSGSCTCEEKIPLVSFYFLFPPVTGPNLTPIHTSFEKFWKYSFASACWMIERETDDILARERPSRTCSSFYVAKSHCAAPGRGRDCESSRRTLSGHTNRSLMMINERRTRTRGQSTVA